MTTKPRNSHPYHMHEAIVAKPGALVRVVERNESTIDEFTTQISSCERVVVAGIGTSQHASLVSEHPMRAYADGTVAAFCLPSRARAGPALIASGETACASRGPTSRGVCR
jgi:glucosamine 6-phosphate synthetase-like amidotransferase/phosphosugar isomerase protein